MERHFYIEKIGLTMALQGSFLSLCHYVLSTRQLVNDKDEKIYHKAVADPGFPIGGR